MLLCGRGRGGRARGRAGRGPRRPWPARALRANVLGLLRRRLRGAKRLPACRPAARVPRDRPPPAVSGSRALTPPPLAPPPGAGRPAGAGHAAAAADADGADPVPVHVRVPRAHPVPQELPAHLGPALAGTVTEAFTAREGRRRACRPCAFAGAASGVGGRSAGRRVGRSRRRNQPGGGAGARREGRCPRARPRFRRPSV